MAIPVYLQGIKSAGIYRIVFDKSTISNEDTTTLRLLVGYSDKGPFNIPTYVKSAADFISLYGGINKTQERRGNFFHRTAIQMLTAAPILCLNLKKFNNEKVTGVQIDTNFNADKPLDTVKIPVADVYDTTRFWSLDPEKLNDVRGAEYINIATTDVKANSASIFIRKASGSKVSGYNVTVSDWYKNDGQDIPEFLEGYENELMSAFFAEVYVFGGKFTAEQVLASDTLKNYFKVNKDGDLTLRQYVTDSFGDYVDTLDYLYEDESSNAIGHYVGCLIPKFKDKYENYAALDIVFNQDSDAHHMMMSFNEDMLYEYGTANIDLSGARYISTDTSIPENRHRSHDLAKQYKQYGTGIICITDLWKGIQTSASVADSDAPATSTSLLGNLNAPVVTDHIEFTTSLYNSKDKLTTSFDYSGKKRITGLMYVQTVTSNSIKLGVIGEPDESIEIDFSAVPADTLNIDQILVNLGAAYVDEDGNIQRYPSGLGTYYSHTDAYSKSTDIEGPKKVIVSISRDLTAADNVIALSGNAVKCNIEDVYITTKRHYNNAETLVNADDDSESWAVYGSSVTFIPRINDWEIVPADGASEADAHTWMLVAPTTSDTSIISMLEKGDQFLAEDKSADMDGDGDYDDEKYDGFYDLCYVQETGTVTYNGTECNYVKFTGKVASYNGETEGTNEDVVITSDNYALLPKNQKYHDIDGATYNTLKSDEDLAEYLKNVDKTWDALTETEQKQYKKYYENSFRLRQNGDVTEYQYRWEPYEYKATYTAKITKDVDSSVWVEYDDDTKALFKVSQIKFGYQVNPAEYSLLNASAKAMCHLNYDGKTYTFIYNVAKDVYVTEDEAIAAATAAGITTPVTAQVVDKDANEIGYVYVTKNDNIVFDDTNDKYTITLVEAAVKYDGSVKGYVASAYHTDEFPSAYTGVPYTVEQFKENVGVTVDEYATLDTETKKLYADNPVEVNCVNALGTTDKVNLHLRVNVLTENGAVVTYTVSKYIDRIGVNTDGTTVNYIVRINRGLNQEIGTMSPIYLEGYTYENPKPDGTSQRAKLNWQNYQLSALTEYKGIRTGLLNKSEVNFRYVVDGFESYIDAGIKKVLSYLCKEKQSAFCIANYPAVKTFVKCPYTSFTDDKGVFNAEYVAAGYNKKKAHTTAFSLPSNDEGASFVAFYSPLKISDGTIDSVVPSAGIVSNLFMEKYTSRYPYSIVAGPNYGNITASGLIGPDYNYSRDELDVLEPMGVNCMVYRPGFGTFINANQTAKQSPKSALSSVNVRELVIYLMDEIETILQSYQWEFNNQTVRNKIKDRADSVCALAKANGGLNDYLNVMDSSNNTADIIDNEMAVISTHIEPGRGMGKMVHELTIYRNGQMNSSIQGE